jgi:hypothetical protein
MARGWESKAVEEQINAREADSQRPIREELTADELERRLKRDSLMLARVRTVAALESAQNERYRAILKKALEDLDAQLAELR